MNFRNFMRRGAWWLLAAALALGAFFFHRPRLAERPMHTDEAVHAVKLGILMETGDYVYNPHEYHGPLIYYAALPFVRAAGARTLAEIPDETPLRLPIVIFGALLVGAVALVGMAMGRTSAVFAALILATSPAFSFYSRYYIQEVPFVLFAVLALMAAWKMLETRRWRWAVAAGAAAGCVIALKETWIMLGGAAGVTAVLLHFTSSRRRWPLAFPWKRFAGLMATAGAVTLITGLAILSNFFRNPAAIGDTFAAILGYLARGVSGDSSTFGANIHDHPWYYYFHLLAWPPVDGPWLWSEGITLLLGVMGLVAIFRRWMTVHRAWHFVGVYTILLTAFYSAIPYKTPWNVLPMLTGWILLAGQGCAWMIALAGGPRPDGGAITQPQRRSRLALALAVTALLLAWPAVLGVQTYRATIARPADIRNPYAYSPTSPNIRKLPERALQLAAVAPEGLNMIIQVISPDNDYWPLPWYLRRFPQIGYYATEDEVSPAAALILSSMAPGEPTLARLAPRFEEFYGLRSELLLYALVRQDLWDAFIAKEMAESVP